MGSLIPGSQSPPCRSGSAQWWICSRRRDRPPWRRAYTRRGSTSRLCTRSRAVFVRASSFVSFTVSEKGRGLCATRRMGADLGFGSGIRGHSGGLRLGLGGEGSCWAGAWSEAGTGFGWWTLYSRIEADCEAMATVGDRAVDAGNQSKKDVVVCVMMRHDDRR